MWLPVSFSLLVGRSATIGDRDRLRAVDTSRTHQELVAMLDDALGQEPAPKPGEKSHADSRDEILKLFRRTLFECWRSGYGGMVTDCAPASAHFSKLELNGSTRMISRSMAFLL